MPLAMNRDQALELLHHSDEIITADTVKNEIQNMAKDISAVLANEFPLILPVMGGATVFTGMLLPLLNFPLNFDYIHLTRYNNTMKGGETQWRVSPAESVKDRTVLILDDILDEGWTMYTIKQRMLELGVKQFFCAVLCDKKIEQKKPLQADFIGFSVPNRYVFGCGMDAKGYWRNLPNIRALRDN